MHPIPFEQAVMAIYERDQRIAPPAFIFLKDSLDHALEKAREDKSRDNAHVTAQELLFSLRDYALEEYGPMAMTLFEEWGISKTADIGWMVFALIEQGMFGKQDSDSENDFDDVFDFHDTFAAPFLPSAAL